MGPRLVSRGKSAAITSGAENYSLQWGRDLLVAESGLRIGGAISPRRLQWGRDLLVAESPPSQLLC